MSQDKDKLKFPKEEFKKWAVDVGKAAADIVEEVVVNIKAAADEQGQKKQDAKYKKDLDALHPVFRKDFVLEAPVSTLSLEGGKASLSRHPSLPSIIHIANKDKKHLESPACADAVGHISVENDLKVLTIYPEYIKQLGLIFFPDTKRSIYYVDPFQKNLYVDIEEYFEQQKTARVRELEQLAYDLGATHAEIVFITKTKEADHEQKKAEIAAKKGKQKVVDAKAEHEEKENQEESIEVRSVLDLGGHNEPHVPELVYFKRDPDIQKLIFMRTDMKKKKKKKEYSIKYSKASGIKTKDAAKIQGAIMKMGGSAEVSLVEEASRESHTTLIYKIEFGHEEIAKG